MLRTTFLALRRLEKPLNPVVPPAALWRAQNTGRTSSLALEGLVPRVLVAVIVAALYQLKEGIPIPVNDSPVTPFANQHLGVCGNDAVET